MERDLRNKQQREDYLYQAIRSFQTIDECKRFLSDLLTPRELKAFVNRWAAASLLLDGLTNDTIVKLLGVSSTTVSRVNATVQRGRSGYKQIWEIIRKIPS